jgi:hypothetical protein
MTVADITMVDRPNRLRPQFFVLPLLMVFTSPALSVLTVLALVALGGVYTRIQKRLFWPLLFILAAFLLAFLGVLFYSPYPAERVESSKFLFMALTFWVGFSSGLQNAQIHRLAMIISGTILGWYLFSVSLGVDIPFFYPPDFNNSAVLIVFLAFLLTEGRGFVFRMAIIGLLVVFSDLAQSRIVLLFAPAFFVSQPVSFSVVRVVGISICILAGIYLMASAGKFGSFSDLVRIEIYTAGLTVIVQNGFQVFTSGPQNFVDALNAILPPFITNRFYVEHAHNAFLDIIGSYGIGTATCFIVFFLGILRFSIIKKNDTLRNQIIIILLLMMVETVISDSRVMFAVLLFLGMQAGHTVDKSKQTKSAQLFVSR